MKRIEGLKFPKQCGMLAVQPKRREHDSPELFEIEGPEFSEPLCTATSRRLHIEMSRIGLYGKKSCLIPSQIS